MHLLFLTCTYCFTQDPDDCLILHRMPSDMRTVLAANCEQAGVTDLGDLVDEIEIKVFDMCRKDMCRKDMCPDITGAREAQIVDELATLFGNKLTDRTLFATAVMTAVTGLRQMY